MPQPALNRITSALLTLLLLTPMLVTAGVAPVAERAQVPTFRHEYPVVNLPFALRQRNWSGSQGEGSCVHASMTMLFRWQGRYNMANWWRTHNGNGEWAEDLAAKFDRAGVRFAYTNGRGDVSFLEWACNTRRGAGVSVMGGTHMLCLVHLDERRAALLDNNHIERVKWVPRERFLSEWKNSGSWAVTPVYAPTPPLPY